MSDGCYILLVSGRGTPCKRYSKGSHLSSEARKKNGLTFPLSHGCFIGILI